MSKATETAKTLILVFLATVIGMVITSGTDILSVSSWTDAKPYVAAGVTAVLVYVYNFLSPFDQRYGVGANDDLE